VIGVHLQLPAHGQQSGMTSNSPTMAKFDGTHEERGGSCRPVRSPDVPAGLSTVLADKLITRPPYSDPHHSASVASIVGGGQRMAKPGAISCAHARVSLYSMRRCDTPRHLTVRIFRFLASVVLEASVDVLEIPRLLTLARARLLNARLKLAHAVLQVCQLSLHLLPPWV
jgi:Magnesium chelatase, subunit ChlI